VTLPAYLTADRLVLESTARRESRAVALNGDAILCRVLGKYLMFAAPEDDSVTPHLVLNGYWESWTTLALARVLRPGMNAVDVGANHGYFSLMMADAAGPNGRVLAIEPNPRLAGLLVRTMTANGFATRTSVVAGAVAPPGVERALLAIPTRCWADATIRQSSPGDDVVEVPTVTVDTATESWGRVDVIKIDTEGSEEAAWLGMDRTIQRNPHICIVMEFKRDAYGRPADLLDRIRSYGFPLRHLDESGALQPLNDQTLASNGRSEWTLFLQR
jgi:FkbM family methyltransferase